MRLASNPCDQLTFPILAKDCYSEWTYALVSAESKRANPRVDPSHSSDLLLAAIRYPQAPTHPQALQKSQPSLRMTVMFPHSPHLVPFISAGSSLPRGMYH